MKLKSIFYQRQIDLVLLFILSLIVNDCSGEFLWKSAQFKTNSLCNFCGTTSTDFLKENCHGSYTSGRCCLDPSNSTIGIDLGNCSIQDLPKLTSMEGVSWVNLGHNPELKCNEENFTTFFKGFRHLQTIILPSQCNSCPGGDNVWHSHSDDNGSAINCTGQLDNCHVFNRTCPENSYCASNGPGFYQCLCSKGYIGYRCMQMSGMPWILAISTIAGGTLVITLPIWILIQRRKKIHRSGFVVME